MSTPEDKLETAASTVAAEIAKGKAWYATHTFWAGVIGGAILCGALVHFFKL